MTMKLSGKESIDKYLVSLVCNSDEFKMGPAGGRPEIGISYYYTDKNYSFFLLVDVQSTKFNKSGYVMSIVDLSDKPPFSENNYACVLPTAAADMEDIKRNVYAYFSKYPCLTIFVIFKDMDQMPLSSIEFNWHLGQ